MYYIYNPPFNKLKNKIKKIVGKPQNEIHMEQIKEFDLRAVHKTIICDHYKSQQQLRKEK